MTFANIFMLFCILLYVYLSLHRNEDYYVMIKLTKEYITGLIERQGMTRPEFAAKMGYEKRQYLDAMLNTQKKDIETVVKMADVLGIPLLELIGESEDSMKDRVFGCIYINGKAHLINSKEDIKQLSDELSK